MSSNAPLQAADIPAVAALFYRAFRDGSAPPADFVAYLADLFLGSPSHDPGMASLVHRASDGTIDAALLVLPMPVSVNGRVLTGRLMSNYMTDPMRRTSGGADLVLTIRARNQDLAFSDSANHVSADHWKAVGGHVLPIQSLDFRRIFRPAGWLVDRHRRRLGPLAALARPLAALADRLMHALRPMPPIETGTTGAPLSRTDFIALAPTLVERFAVHPVWPAAELDWLLHMAARTTTAGPLHLREMRDSKGQLCGCAVFYARPGGRARVLNILTRPGREQPVVAELLAHLHALGCVSVEGMAQPFLMETLSRQRGVTFVPRGFYCISTRHADIVDAAQRGNIYLGGLMGEDWSRLVTDFHD